MFPKRPRLSGDPVRTFEMGVRVHGHPGPFLALGVRLGLKAREVLGARGYFDMEVEVGCPLRTPYSCMIDGVMAATGCTPGKKNLKVKRSSSPYLRARSGEGREVVLRPREELWVELTKGFPMEEAPKLAEEVLQLPEDRAIEIACKEGDSG